MPKKRMSKRIPLKKKYKIKKKIADHNRKVRKAAKKNPSFIRKKLDKAVATSIPNSFPFKGDMLKEIQEMQQQKMEEKIQMKQGMQKEARALEFAKKRQLEGNPDMYKYAQTSLEADLAFTNKHEDRSEMLQNIKNAAPEKKDTSMGAYYHEFRKVVEASDVIIEVLDARDPMGCRCIDIENTIATRYPNKKIILLLNKVDLVPRQNVEKWMAYLRNSYPTVAFKASTQKKGKISHSKSNFTKASDVDLQSAESLGADALLQLLKHFARNGGVKTIITVGLVGFPNVGKSSVINSLCRIRAAKVGATPGLTKSSQEVHLDKHVKLLDTPGIVFPKTNDVSDDLILRNVVKLEQVQDPISPVSTIIDRCGKTVLLSIYKTPDFNSTEDFLRCLAKKIGKLSKGGLPNMNAAARVVLQDWTGGRIPFYTEPPKIGKNVHVSATIVSSFGKDFDVTQAKLLDSIQEINPDNDLHAVSLDIPEPIVVDDVFMGQNAAEEEDSDDDVPAVVVATTPKSSKKTSKANRNSETAPSKKQDLADEADQFNPQVNQEKKKQLKKDEKKKLREKRRRADATMGPGEAYDFKTDFVSVREIPDEMDDDDVDVDL